MKFLRCIAVVLWVALAGRTGGVEPAVLMPRGEDFSHMWWADGFPGNVPAAPWLRVIQTGRFALALDTEALTIPHFGGVQGSDYATAARADNRAWARLPAAPLALSLTVDGKVFRNAGGGKWSRFGGPRLIESGRFVQRADVTDLAFVADDGERLNGEARFETVAWPDRVALIFAARPGLMPLALGEACFGRVGGGFGLVGTNHFEIPHAPELDQEKFTLELWAFVPVDFRPSQKTEPWLVCKNRNEAADGNYGIVLLGERPEARLNIGGGGTNAFSAGGRAQLRIEQWNHLAMSYDGDVLRLFVNGALSGETKIGRSRKPGRDGLAIGRRQDNSGDGYHFRGAIDEIRFHDRALTAAEVRERFAQPEAAGARVQAVREWCFRADGLASPTKPGLVWTNAAMEIRLTGMKNDLHQRMEWSAGESWSNSAWREVSVVLDERTGLAPVRWLGQLFSPPTAAAPLVVQAAEIPSGTSRPVRFDAARGWHAVNLDGIEPIVPAGAGERRNDAVERVKLLLENPADREQVARLLFEKTAHGFRQRIGSAVTGMSAMLRDTDGNPTGIPVQLSKNWHNDAEGGVYAGAWFHGFSQVRLPPRAKVELELTIAYGHWGGVAAASHAQLSLVGWGSNQLWDESALGSWGESICYEPDQAQGKCAVLDVRPLMVKSMKADQRWGWTHNVGGGDFFRLFDATGQRVFPARMRTAYEKQGPCLTEVTYAGRLGDGIEHAATVSLARTDDIVRGTYRLRLDVKKPVEFSRFIIFQIGADSYTHTSERKMALGNETGLLREWETRWGGATNRTEPAECVGRAPWISLHVAVPRRDKDEQGAWANRGIVIRSWSARLGGKAAAPWMVEHGANVGGRDTSTADLVPPPGVTRLEPGDFVEATFEHIVMPQFADDYYGPNESLRTALKENGNTWRMIHREAAGNDRRVVAKTGRLERVFPDVRLRADDDAVEFTIEGGIGYVPLTITGLTTPRGHALFLDGKRADQSVHGNDFWQTDYDAVAKRWSQTFTLPAQPGIRTFRFAAAQP